MNTYKTIDLTYLESLAKGNKDFIQEMIAIFLQETPKELEKLETAIREENFEKIKSTSHHMKSTISFMGLDTLIKNELVQIENLALAQTDITTIKNYFVKVDTICKQAIKELST